MEMNKKKKISSIFDNFDVSASQEIYLRRCGFAAPGQPPPDSDLPVGVSPPPLNDGGIGSQCASDQSEFGGVIGSGYDVVESQAIRFVSPPDTDTVDIEEDAADPTVEVEAEKQSDVPLASRVDESSNPLFNRASSSSGKEDGEKKLKIPLREVVKAIVMNSRNTNEGDDKEIEKMSCVQILLDKGFKF